MLVDTSPHVLSPVSDAQVKRPSVGHPLDAFLSELMHCAVSTVSFHHSYPAVSSRLSVVVVVVVVEPVVVEVVVVVLLVYVLV